MCFYLDSAGGPADPWLNLFKKWNDFSAAFSVSTVLRTGVDDLILGSTSVSALAIDNFLLFWTAKKKFGFQVIPDFEDSGCEEC